jgi:hypothetical protein
MSDIGGLMFLIVLIIIIVGIVVLKITYDLWATSVTINLLKNNSGSLSGKHIIIWVAVIIIIAIILGILGKRQQQHSQY